MREANGKTYIEYTQLRGHGVRSWRAVILTWLRCWSWIAVARLSNGARLATAASMYEQQTEVGHGVAEHVLMIGIDGLGSLYMQNATSFLPHIGRLLANGAHSFQSRIQPPAISAPNWVSLVASLPPRDSGVYGNDWTPERASPPNSTIEWLHPISGEGEIPECMWKTAKLQDPLLRTCVAASWRWLRHLCEADTCDSLTVGSGPSPDDIVTQALVSEIAAAKPSLMFLHLDQVDSAGHDSFWGSDEYYEAAKGADTHIGNVLDALRKAGIYEKTLIALVADHGGYGNDHGLFSLSDMLVPVALHGPCVRRNYTIVRPLSTLDVAPTLLRALGVRIGKFMRGKAINEAFTC